MAVITEQDRKAKGSAHKHPLWFTRFGSVLASLLVLLGVFAFVPGILSVVDGNGYDAVLFIASAFGCFFSGALLGAICEISKLLADQRKNGSETLLPN